LRVVGEHIGRYCNVRLKVVRNGAIGACSGRAVDVCTIGIEAELVDLSEPIPLAERWGIIGGV
jgi:hypothetical protein